MDIKNYFKNSEEIRSFYISAEKKLKTGQLQEAYQDFKRAGDALRCAYCLFLGGNIKDAERIINGIKDESPPAKWLFFLIMILTGRQAENPSYFQIRNLYEPLMNMLLQYKNYAFADCILKNTDYLSKYNLEIYKYAARVMLDNGEAEKAVYYLKKSADILYNDPEMHFMLAEAYEALGNIKEAENECIKSNEAGKGYYPAVKKLKELRGSAQSGI